MRLLNGNRIARPWVTGALLLAGLACASPAHPGGIDRDLARQLRDQPTGPPVRVVVQFSVPPEGQVALTRAAGGQTTRQHWLINGATLTLTATERGSERDGSSTSEAKACT